MADVARKYGPARGDQDTRPRLTRWEEMLREAVRETFRAGPHCEICFEELLIEKIRPVVATRHVARELEARERWDAGFAAGLAARGGRLRAVPGGN